MLNPSSSLKLDYSKLNAYSYISTNKIAHRFKLEAWGCLLRILTWHLIWLRKARLFCSVTGKFSLDDSELSIFLQRCELLENQPDHYWCFQIHDLFICMEFIHQASSFLSCKHSLYNCYRYKIQYFIKDYCYIQCFSLTSHMKSKLKKKHEVALHLKRQ